MSRQAPSMMRRLKGIAYKLPMMITCEAFEEFILDYLDDALDQRRRFVFELHLKVCRECRDYLKAYRAAVALARENSAPIDSKTLEKVPEDLVRAVLAARET